jgi:hypothetical protein
MPRSTHYGGGVALPTSPGFAPQQHQDTDCLGTINSAGLLNLILEATEAINMKMQAQDATIFALHEEIGALQVELGSSQAEAEKLKNEMVTSLVPKLLWMIQERGNVSLTL